MPLLKKRAARQRVVEKSEHHPREFRKLVSGGLAGFSGVSVLQLLGVSHLDTPLKLAVWAFAIAIPLLVRDLVDAKTEERHGITVDFDLRSWATVVGITAALFGIASIFFHFDIWFGVLFSALSIGCGYSSGKYMEALSEEAKPDE